MEKLVGGYHNWVTGDRFWDREREMELLIGKLDAEAHLRIIAQRRIGKTSLIREAARRIGDRYLCLYVDLEKAAGPADAVVELSKIAYPHLDHGLFSDIFPSLLDKASEKVEKVNLKIIEFKLRDDLTSGNWKEKGDKLFDAIAKADKPAVIFLDEITTLVNLMLKGDDYQITPERKGLTHEFMSWLRSNTIKHKGRIRFVMTGSIGFEPILGQAQMSATINTLEPFEIQPWDSLTAVNCLMALAANYEVNFVEGALDRMVEKLGCCIPHHVQIFFQHVYDGCKLRGNMQCTISDVESFYSDSLLGAKGLVELSHYEERLKMALGDRLFPLAVDLLTEAAVIGHLVPENASRLAADHGLPPGEIQMTLRNILEVLEHDGYLRKESHGWVFVSRLLRDWWKGRNENFFVPAVKRSAPHA